MSAKLGVLKGHTQAVLCAEVLSAQHLLATGGEDGMICVHDLRSNAMTANMQISKEEAVPSLILNTSHPYYILACAGGDLFELDMRKGDATCCLRQQTCTTAEINHLAAAPEGNLLAAADDDGYVTAISIGHQQHGCQRLNSKHDNICSSVIFRQHKPHEGFGWTSLSLLQLSVEVLTAS